MCSDHFVTGRPAKLYDTAHHWALLLNLEYNYVCRTVLCKRKGSFTSAAHRELGLSTLASRRKLYLALTMSNCMSFKSPPYLSFFSSPLFHYNTLPIHLLSSTFHLINLFGHSVSWVQHCHRTFETPDTSIATTHFASNIFTNDI